LKMFYSQCDVFELSSKDINTTNKEFGSSKCIGIPKSAGSHRRKFFSPLVG
jgi:hypothetical protein